MKLSFIIPTLNEQQNIAACLSSILPQLKDGEEAIVVDNGSTDKTVVIAKALSARVLREKKKGISNARNRGATAARGDILCFVDADGVISPNWASLARAGLKDRDTQAIVGLNIFVHYNMFKYLLYNSYTLAGFTGLVANKFITGNLYLSGNNIAIRKDLFTKLGGFEPVIAEDFWLSKKFWKLKNKKAFFNKKMVIWYSSRGFDAAGYYKTLFLWVKSATTKQSQENYSYKSKSP